MVILRHNDKFREPFEIQTITIDHTCNSKDHMVIFGWQGGVGTGVGLTVQCLHVRGEVTTYTLEVIHLGMPGEVLYSTWDFTVHHFKYTLSHKSTNCMYSACPCGSICSNCQCFCHFQILYIFPESHVLACAPSNGAADLLLERVSEHTVVPKSQMLRLNAFGRNPRTLSEKLKVFLKTSKLKMVIKPLSQYQLVC